MNPSRLPSAIPPTTEEEEAAAEEELEDDEEDTFFNAGFIVHKPQKVDPKLADVRLHLTMNL